MACRWASAGLVLLWSLGCAGHDGEGAAEPQAARGEVGATAGGEGAAASGGGEGTDGASRPCQPYVDGVLSCAAEATGPGAFSPEDKHALANSARSECRTWMDSGLSGPALERALFACEDRSCADGPREWHDCVVGGLPVEAVTEPPAGTVEFTRIAPRAFDAGADSCMTFMSWMLGCMNEATGGSPLPAEAVEAMRSAFLQACDAWREQPQMFAALAPALRACADVACGSGGSDLVTCITQELTGVLSGGTGSPPSP